MQEPLKSHTNPAARNEMEGGSTERNVKLKTRGSPHGKPHTVDS